MPNSDNLENIYDELHNFSSALQSLKEKDRDFLLRAYNKHVVSESVPYRLDPEKPALYRACLEKLAQSMQKARARDTAVSFNEVQKMFFAFHQALFFYQENRDELTRELDSAS